jgi:hypothetical protein
MGLNPYNRIYVQNFQGVLILSSIGKHSASVSTAACHRQSLNAILTKATKTPLTQADKRSSSTRGASEIQRGKSSVQPIDTLSSRMINHRVSTATAAALSLNKTVKQPPPYIKLYEFCKITLW